MENVDNYLKNIGEQLRQKYARKVLLFGSYATGNYEADSDIDLLIIADTQEKFYARMATVKRLLREYRRGIPLSPIVFTPQELENRQKKGDQFILEILEKGIEL